MATEANIKVKTDSTQAQKGLGGVVDKLKGMNTAALAAGAAFAAVGTVAFKFAATVTQEFADAGDAIHKMSGRTGVGAENLQRLSHAFELNGANIKMAETGFKTLNKALFNANDGAAKSIEIFEQLGLSWREVAAASPFEQFKMVMEALAGVEDHTTRATLAQLALGKAGVMMLPSVVDGYESLAKALERADELSIVLTESQINAAAALTDAKFEMSEVWANFREEIGSRLAPMFQKSFEGMTEKIRMFRDWVLKAMDKIEEFMPAIRLIGSLIKAYFAPQLFAAKELLKLLWSILKPIIIGFNALAKSFENTSSKAGENSMVMGRVVKIMSQVGKVFNLGILAIGGVAWALNKLIENWRSVARMYLKAYETLINLPIKLINAYLGAYQVIIDAYINFLNKLVALIPDWLMPDKVIEVIDIANYQLPRINELTLDWVDNVKKVESSMDSVTAKTQRLTQAEISRNETLSAFAAVTAELGAAELKVAEERANDLAAIEGYEQAVATSAKASNWLVDQINEQMAAKIKASEIAKIAADNDLAMIEGYEQATKHAGFYSNWLVEAIHRETDAKIEAAEIAIAAAEAAKEAEKKLAQERFSQAMKNADDTQKLALAITRSIEIARKEGTYDPSAQQTMYKYAGARGQLQQWYFGAEGQKGMWGAMNGGQTDAALDVSEDEDDLPKAHKGGRIGGPVGRETPIMALGGETVLPIGGNRGVTINFNGLVAGDPVAIGREIANIVNKSSRANGAIINSSAVTS